MDAAAGAAPTRVGRSFAVVCLLLCATIFHAAAVIFPFVEMRALLSTEVYGLIPSVLMLLDYGMVVLAVLVIVFSIVFPFAKLAVLWLAWTTGSAARPLGVTVHLAETLGKWSMLDVFLVLLLLAVTHDRTLVATKPLLGVPLFLAGVVCTMSAGGLLARRWRSAPVADAVVVPRSAWLLAVWAGCLLAGQTLPLLETDSMLVSDRSFSLLGIAWSLILAGNWGLAVAVVATLLVMPWLALFVHARMCISGASHTGLAAIWHRWAMLDVFALALAIFIVESANAVPSDIRSGAIALGAAVVLGCVIRLRHRVRA